MIGELFRSGAVQLEKKCDFSCLPLEKPNIGVLQSGYLSHSPAHSRIL